MPFCISILTSVRRIVKIAVRFLHTKTALCDRKDTQSRFAVNAARSIVCVGTMKKPYDYQKDYTFQCRTQHCMCRDNHEEGFGYVCLLFQCRTQHCVCWDLEINQDMSGDAWFQCRTQHCVCRDFKDMGRIASDFKGFNAARSIVCVETEYEYVDPNGNW